MVRPPQTEPRDRLVLWGLVLVAAACRFAALGHDLPFSPATGEREVIEQAVRMMKTGDFNPYSYDNPALLLSLHAAVATARLLVGSLTGLWSTLEQAIAADFYLWSRAVTATIGTATIVVTYRLASRFGRLSAATAALLVAVHPGLVRESHYALGDAPTTFLVALTVLLAVRAAERPTMAAFAWAGVATGLAAALTAMSGAALVMPLAALGLAGGDLPRAKTLSALVGSAAAAYVVWVPFGVLGPPVEGRIASDWAVLVLVPLLAVLAGGAVATVLRWSAVRRLNHRWRVSATALVIGLAAAAPTLQTIAYLSTISRTSNHELAYAWILEHVPAGSGLVVEPGLVLPARYDTLPVERVTDRSHADYEAAGIEYVVTTAAIADTTSPASLAARNFLRGMELLVVFTPTAEHPGSEVRVYRLLR